MAFGCIDRQIDALRADCGPPREGYTFGGTVSEGRGLEGSSPIAGPKLAAGRLEALDQALGEG